MGPQDNNHSGNDDDDDAEEQEEEEDRRACVKPSLWKTGGVERPGNKEKNIISNYRGHGSTVRLMGLLAFFQVHTHTHTHFLASAIVASLPLTLAAFTAY
mmetsp:Transcript_3630/g.8223  ORF Transcript_3630/g.8223 Transcript_3630/m.8223 type:complete len:100 (+) Transcript_3630:96-395(+)